MKFNRNSLEVILVPFGKEPDQESVLYGIAMGNLGIEFPGTLCICLWGKCMKSLG